MPCTRALGHGSRPSTGQHNHRDLRRQRKSETRASRSKALGQGGYNGVVSASRQHHGVAVARSRQLVDGFPCLTPTSKVSAAALADSMATCAYVTIRCKPAGLKQRYRRGRPVEFCRGGGPCGAPCVALLDAPPPAQPMRVHVCVCVCASVRVRVRVRVRACVSCVRWLCESTPAATRWRDPLGHTDARTPIATRHSYRHASHPYLRCPHLAAPPQHHV